MFSCFSKEMWNSSLPFHIKYSGTGLLSCWDISSTRMFFFFFLRQRDRKTNWIHSHLLLVLFAHINHRFNGKMEFRPTFSLNLSTESSAWHLAGNGKFKAESLFLCVSLNSFWTSIHRSVLKQENLFVAARLCT